MRVRSQASRDSPAATWPNIFCPTIQASRSSDRPLAQSHGQHLHIQDKIKLMEADLKDMVS